MNATVSRETIISELERLLPWGTPREVSTKQGARMLRKATPTEAFWNAWRAGKDQLKKLGISVSRSDYGAGEWEVCWWTELPKEVVKQRQESVEQSRATDAEIDVPCPDGLAYMPFQRAGIRFAMARRATLIGDEMGLGKTIQAIGFVNGHPEFEKVLVITKASLKVNWWRELRKWLVNPALRSSVGIIGDGVFPSTAVCIINYDICAKYQQKLWAREWDCVIIDEAHTLKNRKAKRTMAVVGYKPGKNEDPSLASSGIPCKTRLALTGTPIENDIEEMWTILWWLDRDTFPSRWKLLSMAGAGNRPGGVTIPPNSVGLAKLQEFLRRTVMVRRLKREVLTELPPKTRVVTEFSPDGMEDLIRAERAMWDANEERRIEAQAELEVAKASNDPRDYEKAIRKLKEVQGIAFEEMARIRRETAVAKIDKMIPHLHERLLEVDKMIVFAHHTECLERFHAEFRGISVIVHGGHSIEQRDSSVHRFQTDPTCRMFFGSIRATGEGLTLTAANYVVFHEYDWVPSKMVQCEDRAHRIGQKDNVTVEVCVVDGTIDAKMAKTCVEKAELADKALDVQVKQEVMEEPAPVVTDWKPLATRRELETNALLVTPDQRQAVADALLELAMMCDGARKIDGAGFSKMDSAIGKALAYVGAAGMSDKQVVLGAKLVRRYQRQLTLSLVERATAGLVETKKRNGKEATNED